MLSKAFILIICLLYQLISFGQSIESRVKDLTEGMYKAMKINKEQKEKLYIINSDYIRKRDSLIICDKGRLETTSPEVESKIQELGNAWRKSIKKIAGGRNFRKWFKEQNITKEQLPYIDIWLSDQE